MTRLDGERLVGRARRHATRRRDRVLGELVSEVAEQILVRGHVHADPHPGNFLVTPDGKLALLDFGCTLELGAAERARVRAPRPRDRRRQPHGAARELAILGFTADDPATARRDDGLARRGDAAGRLGRRARLGGRVRGADRAARSSSAGLQIPRSFVLLGRVLATVAGLLAKYRPQIHIHPLIARHLAAAIA